VKNLRIAVLATLFATTAVASTAVQLDVEALAGAASDVVRVRVASTRCAWTDAHHRIVTLVEVDVLDRWKGPTGGRLTILQPGGELDGVGQRVTGVVRLGTGEEVVLFLERQGAAYRTVGLAQGVYRVSRTSSGAVWAVPAGLEGLSLVQLPGRPAQPRVSVPLDTLRDSVRRAGERE
jgi:hypothetical protein